MTSDLARVTELFNASERADTGEADTTAEDVNSGWAMPDFDLSEDSVMVFDGDRLVGYAESYHWRAEATVHPEARDRGIGTALLAWTEAVTLERRPPDEEARVGQTVPDSNTAATALFTRHGFTPRHTSWILDLPPERTIVPRPLRHGYAIREFEPDAEKRDVFQVIEDAFNEWPNRTPSTFEKWQAWITDRPDFDPDLSFVALHGSEVVGASIVLVYPDEGWVQQLAVHRDHRHKGLAKGLLNASFQAARASGLSRTGLSTDSRTGALDLYLDLGMEIRRSYTHYSKLLRPAP